MTINGGNTARVFRQYRGNIKVRRFKKKRSKYLKNRKPRLYRISLNNRE
jgi:hypothetical protein